MYSREDRIRAVELWLQYGKSTKTVIRELGYPSKTLMRIWYKDYLQEQETGIMHVRRRSAPKYTEQQRQAAIEHYLTHGRCLVRTIRALGFPSRELMSQWCRDLVPIQRKHSGNAVQFSQEQKKDAVIDLCSRQGSAKEIARKHGVTRAVLYKWKDDLLGKERVMAKTTGQADNLPDDKEKLLSEIETLKKDIQRLKMETDILEAAAELIKKDPGVELKDLSNREKTILVGALKNEHPLKDLLAKLILSRSSFYYQRWTQGSGRQVRRAQGADYRAAAIIAGLIGWTGSKRQSLSNQCQRSLFTGQLCLRGRARPDQE